VTKTMYRFLHHTVLLAAGSALCALAVKGILLPQGFLSRGLTGVALLVYHLHPILSVGTMYLLLNIPMFAGGGRFSVVPRKNVANVKKAVLERDPGAFMAFSTAEDVTHPEVGNQPLW